MQNKPFPRVNGIRAAILLTVAALLCILCAVGGYAVLTSRATQPQIAAPTNAVPAEAGAGQTTQPAAPQPQIILATLTPAAPDPAGPTATARPVPAEVESLLSQMSLEQKVGQMIMSVLPGETAAGEGKKLIRENFIGSIIYYHENVNDPVQAAQLSQDLQALAAGNRPAIPVLIAMDYEGGKRDRFESGTVTFPYNMALGAAGSPELAYRAAAAAARQLRSAGIMLSFGPVVDANVEPGNPVIGLRSYGSDPQTVALMGQAAISGLQESGVIAVVKHFPGHGDTKVDSHVEIPVINKTLAELNSGDLIPFARAIDQQAGGIMIGHIANQVIDDTGYPATLSQALVEGILRKDLGYQGVIFTDGMMMGAIIHHYPAQDSTLRAVVAGCDILLITNPNWAVEARNWIIEAVYNGFIEPERIEASARRILTLKAQYGLLSFPLPEPLPVSQEEDQVLAEEIARRAITAGGPAAFPVLSPGEVVLLSPDLLPKGAVEGDGLSLLGELLTRRGFRVEEWIYPVDDPGKADEVWMQAVSELDPEETAVVVTWNAGLRLSYNQDGSQERMVRAVAGAEVPAVYIACGLPYDLSLFPAGAPALATYGWLDIQIQALVDAMLADSAPPGRLPVALPD